MSDVTRERILDSAEKLFAERGYAGTSLRDLTQAASVNLGAVNYHFGSKEGLLKAVLSRIVTPTNQRRLQLLEEAEKSSLTLEAVLYAFIAPDLHLIRDLGERGRIISRFLGRSSAEPSDLVEALTKEQFGDLGQRFVTALAQVLPQLSQEEIYERLHWLIGILTYILADAGPTANHVDVSDTEALTERLIHFAAAGMRAPGSR